MGRELVDGRNGQNHSRSTSEREKGSETVNTPKHTPGPWHVGLKPGTMVYGPQGEQIVGINVMLDSDEVLANAKFIAAAPAMYDALQQSLVLVELAALEEWGRAVRGEQQPPTTEARDRLEKVKAALAQAEGR